RCGIQPVAMIGHSLGELVAACLADVFTLEDGLKLIAARGRLMQAMAPGAMLAVTLPESEALALCGADVSLAAINAPALSVLSGTEVAIAEVERQLGQRGVITRRLETSHAFHSAMLEPALDAFRAEVAAVSMRPPRIPFVSNVTGTWIT